MELSRKTTILLSPALHERLKEVASREGVSMGHLIRQACEKMYGEVTPEDRLEAVRALAGLDLPVGDVATMKRQSLPDVEDGLP